MTLHTDLLAQAELLATKEPSRPSQASLRRSISASYYALFHRLVDEATRRMISRGQRTGLRECLSRSFRHNDMKNLCISIAGGAPPRRLLPAFEPLPLDPHLIAIAKAFADLQDARHRADYNTYRPFKRHEALHFHQLSNTAIADWKSIRKSHQADAFLTGLLIHSRVQG